MSKTLFGGFTLPQNYKKLTIPERRKVREQYVEEQNGFCSHCGAPLDSNPSEEIRRMWIDKSLFPASMFIWPIHLHHDHDTGMTIGAVHAVCNAVLWQYHGE